MSDVQPHDWLAAWSFEPAISIPLVLTAVLYAAGARSSRGITRRRQLLFWGGYGTLALALVSPIHPLGEVLFSVHMLQHEILMLIAAPLLVLSRPLTAFLWGIPYRWRRGLAQAAKLSFLQSAWRLVTRPLLAWLLHASAIWLWHVPALFRAAVENDVVHAAQHLSFLGTAVIFWRSLVGRRGRERYATGVVSIFSTALHTGILGALITFSPVPWYVDSSPAIRGFGLTPLQDQQLGGLIMWIPATVVYAAAGLAIFYQLLSRGAVAGQTISRASNVQTPGLSA